MVLINNANTQREIRAAIGCTGLEVPSQAGVAVLPVFNCNPKDYQLQTQLGAVSSTSSGNTTIFTTSLTRSTYVTSFTLSIIKDATCDLATGAISFAVSVDGIYRSLSPIAVITLTAQNATIAVTLQSPLLIDKNVALIVNKGAHTVGVLSFAAAVTGFERDSFSQ
jgi:hypothetical protein